MRVEGLAIGDRGVYSLLSDPIATRAARLLPPAVIGQPAPAGGPGFRSTEPDGADGRDRAGYALFFTASFRFDRRELRQIYGEWQA